MKIYPKISYQKFSDEVAERIKQSDGIEIQYFNENGATAQFDFESEIRINMTRFPHLKEITIHPPLKDYEIEIIFLKDENIFRNQLVKMVELSKEFNIELNIIYHTLIPACQFVSTNLASRIKECLKIIEGTNVTVLIENLYMILGEDDTCSALEVCKYINHPNLRVCIDTTHVHCKANMFKRDFNELVDSMFDKDVCKKYVKQIHFAAALKNDGYIDKKTHGRKHECVEDVQKEYNWLENHGMGDKNFVTEVREEDYYTRKDQLKEIEMLEKITK